MSSEPREPPRRLGKYELQKRLGHGGMGEVWKALDTHLQRNVAIKVLLEDWQVDQEFVARFTREARFIASLHHPNIVQLHDFQIAYPPEVEVTTAYMVMDFVEGQTLSDFIRHTSRKGLFPAAEDIIYIFTGISLAIDYAHKRGMVHRDIKPANILLDRRPPVSNPLGKPVLIDFGIARLQSAHTGTAIGTLLGTPHYISPEQAKGLHGNHVSDLYSLGIILYEMTTGITPFRGETTMSILMQHIHSEPTPPALINPHIPPELSEVILKSIAKQPEERFQSATKLTIAVAEAMRIPVPRQLPGPTSSASPSLANPPSSSHPSTPVSLSPSLPLTPYDSPSSPQTPPETPPAPPSPSLPVPGSVRRSLAGQSSNPVSSYGSNFGAPDVYHAAPQQPASGYSMHGENQQKPTIITPAPPVQRPAPRRRVMLLGALLALILVIAGAVAWTFYSLPHIPIPPAPTVVASGPVGQVRFINSGHVATGNYDEIQIDLTNIPGPPPGQTYYAWIESASTEQFRPHWQLIPQNGSVHTNAMTYPNHNDLLQPDTILLITLESSSSDPKVPSPALNTRLYYAQLTPLSQTTFTIYRCPANDPAHICLQ
jgi:serine/threonine protein kinase